MSSKSIKYGITDMSREYKHCADHCRDIKIGDFVKLEGGILRKSGPADFDGVAMASVDDYDTDNPLHGLMVQAGMAYLAEGEEGDLIILPFSGTYMVKGQVYVKFEGDSELSVVEIDNSQLKVIK